MWQTFETLRRNGEKSVHKNVCVCPYCDKLIRMVFIFFLDLFCKNKRVCFKDWKLHFSVWLSVLIPACHLDTFRND